jgi:hypothetical protein
MPHFAYAICRTSVGRGRLDINPTNKGYGPEVNSAVDRCR